MASFEMTDPSVLTVDKLKKELLEHNVPLPKYPKKEALVELYKEHILASYTKGSDHRLGFSDDEIVENTKSRKSLGTMSKRRSVTTRIRDDVISSAGVNISDLTDMELIENLQRYGADVGPVTDTTRSVYEKKLAKLLDGGTSRAKTSHISPLKKKSDELSSKRFIHYSDEEDENAEEEEEDEEEAEEEEDEEEAEEEEVTLPKNTFSREVYGSSLDRRDGKDYEDSFTVRKQFTTSNESYEPLTRRSLDFVSRPPLSTFGTPGDAFSSHPLSSGLTSTTRRSHVFSSSEYTSTPRSTPLIRDSLLSGKTSSKPTSKSKANHRGTCFWLLVLFALITVSVLILIILNMDPPFQGLALPMFGSKVTDGK